MLTRAKRASASSAPSSTCRRWSRRSPRRSASSTSSTRRPGRSTRCSRSSGSAARSGSTTRPGRSRRSSMLSLWGIGNIMIIFLAAVLDVPQHLYESAELDGAGPFQRLRWVTLPLISPVILFAVVLGVIQALQYFTQAYVAASVAGGPGLAGGREEQPRARVPAGLDAVLPGAPLLPRVPLLQHGLRVGDGDAAARRRLRGDAPDPPQLAPLGPLPGAAR